MPEPSRVQCKRQNQDSRAEGDGGSQNIVESAERLCQIIYMGCDGHTNYRSHQRCDRSHQLFRTRVREGALSVCSQYR